MNRKWIIRRWRQIRACRISYAITWLLVSSWHVKLNATRIAEALYLCPIRFMESTLTDLTVVDKTLNLAFKEIPTFGNSDCSHPACKHFHVRSDLSCRFVHRAPPNTCSCSSFCWHAEFMFGLNISLIHLDHTVGRLGILTFALGLGARVVWPTSLTKRFNLWKRLRHVETSGRSQIESAISANT